MRRARPPSAARCPAPRRRPRPRRARLRSASARRRRRGSSGGRRAGGVCWGDGAGSEGWCAIILGRGDSQARRPMHSYGGPTSRSVHVLAIAATPSNRRRARGLPVRPRARERCAARAETHRSLMQCARPSRIAVDSSARSCDSYARRGAGIRGRPSPRHPPPPAARWVARLQGRGHLDAHGLMPVHTRPAAAPTGARREPAAISW